MKKIALIVMGTFLVLLIAGCARRPAEVISIEIDWEPKSEYLINETVTIGTKTIDVEYRDGNDELVIGDSNVSLSGRVTGEGEQIALDTSERGEHQITIAFGGVSVTYKFYVYDAIVTVDGYYYWDDEEKFEETSSPIQGALDSLDDGAWVKVKGGEYEEVHDDEPVGVLISKGVTLRSDGDAILNSSTNFTIRITASVVEGHSEVTLKGFIIGDQWKMGGISVPFSIVDPVALHVIDNYIMAPDSENVLDHANSIQSTGDNSTIINNIVFVADHPNENFGGSGILVMNGDNIVIKNNRIHHSNILRGNYSIALASFNKPMSGTIVENNTFLGGHIGLTIQQLNGSVSNTDINNNHFINVERPLHFWNPWGGEYVLEPIYITSNTFEINQVFETNLEILRNPHHLLDANQLLDILENSNNIYLGFDNVFVYTNEETGMTHIVGSPIDN